MDRVRKNAIKIFKETGLKIEIQTHLKIVRFLDVIFSTYRPYEKSNDSSLYINTSSSHPPQLIKQLATLINERLSKNVNFYRKFQRIKI